MAGFHGNGLSGSPSRSVPGSTAELQSSLCLCAETETALDPGPRAAVQACPGITPAPPPPPRPLCGSEAWACVGGGGGGGGGKPTPQRAGGETEKLPPPLTQNDLRINLHQTNTEELELSPRAFPTNRS